MINSKYTTNDCLKVFNFCLGFPVVDSASHPFLASPDPPSLGFRSAQPLTPDSYKYLISAYNITLNETSMSEKLSPSKGALAR